LTDAKTQHQCDACTVLTFNVPSEPRGKARPVVTRFNTYTPDPANWVQDLKFLASNAVNSSGWQMTDEEQPVVLKLQITRKLPANLSKKKRAAMWGLPAPKIPDVVNIVAAVCDALEGIVYRNDRQVFQIEAVKRWGDEHMTGISIKTCTDKTHDLH